MLFFQTVLVAGYAYAHVTTRHLPPRAQAGLHLILLVAALASLPILPDPHWRPGPGTEPVGRILLLLTVCLGLPYFVLSSTGPLLQVWLGRLHPGKVPYRLYALSNAGSLLALVSFPTFFERMFRSQTLAAGWAAGFGAYVLVCGHCAWRIWRLNPEVSTLSGTTMEAGAAAADCHVPPGRRALWFGFSACGSVLLLATTNKLCQDVAAVPFLWVLPLGLYLLTFIACFDSPFWYFRRLFSLLLFPLMGLLCYVLLQEHTPTLAMQVGTYGACLFVACMVCHGEVYRLRPGPRFLTGFYLLIAAGGASGGVFVAVVAPWVFRSYAELSWGFCLLGVLLFWVHFGEDTAWSFWRRRWPVWPAVLAGVTALAVVFVVVDRREAENVVSMSRNFYGVLRVVELMKDEPVNRAFQLRHGDISHGLQFADPLKANLLTTYYHEQSGIGFAFRYFPRQTNRRIGAVGLGVGTLAAYGRPGDSIRFYEIDPDVKRLAETRFTYLRDCRGRVEVVLGDARLSMEKESPQGFDLLALDAFSGDAIPVHLLTREAFATYLRHLKSDGVLAVHISNAHLELFPVMRSLAANFDLGIAHIGWFGRGGPWWINTSRWVLLSRNQSFLRTGPIAAATRNLRTDPMEAPLWTDDHASLITVLNMMVRLVDK